MMVPSAQEALTNFLLGWPYGNLRLVFKQAWGGLKVVTNLGLGSF